MGRFCGKGTPAWAEEQRWEYLSSMINKELNQVFSAHSSGSLGQYVHLRNHYSRKRLPAEFPPLHHHLLRDDIHQRVPHSFVGAVYAIIAILVLGKSEAMATK